MTAPINVVVSLLMGASFAAYAQRIAPTTGAVCRAALGALVLAQLMVFVPTTAYVHWRFSQWSTMYLFSVEGLPAPMWTVSLLYPGWAVAGFFVAWRAGQRANPKRPWIVLATGAALLVLIVVLGRHRLGWVGSANAFADGRALTPLALTPLPVLMAVALPAVAACWAGALWRLHLLYKAPPAPVLEWNEPLAVEVETCPAPRQPDASGEPGSPGGVPASTDARPSTAEEAPDTGSRHDC